MKINTINEKLNRDVLSIAKSLKIKENECINVAAITYMALMSKGYSPRLIIGSLRCNGKSIFECPENLIPTNLTKDEFFDGHIWIECSGFIIDIAIIFTIMKMRELCIFLLNEGLDLQELKLCTPIDNDTQSVRLDYIKHQELLDNEVINALMLGAQCWLQE